MQHVHLSKGITVEWKPMQQAASTTGTILCKTILNFTLKTCTRQIKSCQVIQIESFFLLDQVNYKKEKLASYASRKLAHQNVGVFMEMIFMHSHTFTVHT